MAATKTFDLLHLRTVLAIADFGGFHRAASELHLSQSTVSQHVRAIEKLLGQPVVQRVGRSTRFTVAGQALLAEARRILAVHDESVQRLAVSHADQLVIGCVDYLAAIVLPRLLVALAPQLDGYPVSLLTGRSPQIIDLVDEGQVHLGFVVSAPGVAARSAIGELALQWYGSEKVSEPSAENSSENSSGPAEQMPIPLVMMADPSYLRHHALAALARTEVPTRIAAEASTVAGAQAAAAAGLGVVLLPELNPGPGLSARSGLPGAEHLVVDAIVGADGPEELGRWIDLAISTASEILRRPTESPLSSTAAPAHQPSLPLTRSTGPG